MMVGRGCGVQQQEARGTVVAVVKRMICLAVVMVVVVMVVGVVAWVWVVVVCKRVVGRMVAVGG